MHLWDLKHKPEGVCVFSALSDVQHSLVTEESVTDITQTALFMKDDL